MSNLSIDKILKKEEAMCSAIQKACESVDDARFQNSLGNIYRKLDKVNTGFTKFDNLSRIEKINQLRTLYLNMEDILDGILNILYLKKACIDKLYTQLNEISKDTFVFYRDMISSKDNSMYLDSIQTFSQLNADCNSKICRSDKVKNILVKNIETLEYCKSKILKYNDSVFGLGIWIMSNRKIDNLLIELNDCYRDSVDIVECLLDLIIFKKPDFKME